MKFTYSLLVASGAIALLSSVQHRDLTIGPGGLTGSLLDGIGGDSTSEFCSGGTPQCCAVDALGKLITQGLACTGVSTSGNGGHGDGEEESDEPRETGGDERDCEGFDNDDDLLYR
ncbi:hypothetical protein BKA67DRAFT_535586 [Truncatella angustata]|uniref:Hydrophobin n=1 Tax=Truncatella angustata TaxID=152316 RepID=A0A9P8UL80_9PEZI|nr:uncharacterized protein BKA67DRAFT_535586 [Truncatella angustata]KAH6654254.1 hypothetical protein BKA67DRAFT_535586 [Truncatella angustata]